MISESHYYEISYLLPPSLSQEEAGAVDNSLRQLITDEKSVLESWDYPKRRMLSYEISNVKEAFMGALRLHATTEQILKIGERLKERKDIMRFSLLRWRKNPLRVPKAHKIIRKEEQVPIDEKTLDEKLEEILVQKDESQ